MVDKKIVIIENHPDNGRIMANYFISLGYQAALATNIEEAIPLCRIVKPGVIVAELRITNKEGLNIMEVMQHQRELRHIPVICISTETSQRLIDRAKALGAYAFIAKPVSNEMLARVIENITAAPRHAVALATVA